MLRQKTLDHELDLALTYKSPIGDDRIESHLLFQSRLCLIARKGVLKGVGKEASVQDLTRFPLALPSKGLQARDTLESILYAQNVSLDIRLEINSVRSLLDLIANSSLVTMLSEESIRDKRMWVYRSAARFLFYTILYCPADLSGRFGLRCTRKQEWRAARNA